MRLAAKRDLHVRPDDTYTCAACGGTFGKDRSDEDALGEMHRLFGKVPDAERVVVCDDCWLRMERRRVRQGIPLDRFYQR